MMTKNQLLEKLKEINERDRHDPETCHSNKDEALLDYIKDKAVTGEFSKGDMWYA